ncbi:MAG: restriction endonuclease [Planctomycetes bacterium]|nr:restriction endonuclease [Planctomycetota bacterium]
MPETLNPVQRVLKLEGPLESQQLALELVRKKLTKNQGSARQAIRRATQRNLIRSTAPVRFDKAFLYFLPEHHGKKYAKAVRKLLEQKPTLHRVYKTILANKGFISYGQIGKASACLPAGDESNAGGRHTLPEVVEELLALGLIDKIAGVSDIYRIGSQFGAPEISRGLFEHKLQIEQQLLMEARDWLRDCYLLAYDSHSIRTFGAGTEHFNQSIWDLHGPMYMGPFTRDRMFRRTSATEAFVVCEIIGYRTFGTVDAEALLERYKSIVLRWSKIVVTAIAIAPAFSKPAWKALRSAGIIPVVFRDVFGRNVDELLQALWKAFGASGVTSEKISDIENALSLASGTIIDEGIIGNLKGALFELIVALAWKVEGYDVTLQKKVLHKEDGEQFEIDIVAVKGDVCKLIECKGHHADYQEGKEEIKRHFSKRCKAAADKYGWDVTENYKSVNALFITSGELNKEAQKYADSTKKSHGITCSVWSRSELMNWLNSNRQQKLREIIRRFYASDE